MEKLDLVNKVKVEQVKCNNLSKMIDKVISEAKSPISQGTLRKWVEE